MAEFKSEKKGSNIICRVSNATPEMVCRYVQRLPKHKMSEEAFRDYMGPKWFQNEHQAPEQWGLYYIDGEYYYPRFNRDITIEEAERYLYGWIKRLIVINPYTRFKVTNDNRLVESIVKQLEINPDEHNLRNIISNVINSDEPFVLNEILANAINNYSEVLRVDYDRDNEIFYAYLLPNYKEIIKTKYNMTKKEYFDSFNDINTSAPLNEPNQVIYYGAPGTGKSHEVKKQTGELLPNGEKVDLPNVFRTTFHPDTDYASFVGCYKPTMRKTGKKHQVDGKDVDDEEIIYEYVPQVFTDAYVYAYKNPDTQTYLVLEEINRGNCAQIFGDLFQLLDRKEGVSEYKIKADNDLAKYLVAQLGEESEGIKDGKLCLPDNLNILATMNTSDQSLFPMDSAFKRRWDWEYVPINYSEEIKSGSFDITIGEKVYSWVKFIEKVNEKIFALTESEDKQMGNFFIKHSVDENEFKSKVMFYLWYEVLRDETGNNKYFFRQDTIDGKDSTPFTFKDLYKTTSKETIQQFMAYLGVEPK